MRRTLLRCAAASPTHAVLALVGGAGASLPRRVASTQLRRSGASPRCVSATPARTFFGGWAASKPAGLTAEPVLERNNGNGSVAPPDFGSAALLSEVQQLQQQVRDLKEALDASQEAVKQLLQLNTTRQQQLGMAKKEASNAAAAVTRECCGHGGKGACYVVRTSEELTDALRGVGSEHAARTVVLDGSFFVLDPAAAVFVHRARVSIVGNNATVIGQIAVRGRGALLSASDVFFLAPGDIRLRLDASAATPAAAGAPGGGAGVPGKSKAAAAPLLINPTGRKEKDAAAILMPVVSVTSGAGLHLNRCVLSNGRDGVYLGMGSHCTLNHVRVVNCIRGLYEGVGCQASTVSDCVFQSNRYHMVLLGANNGERAAQLFKSAANPSTGGAAIAAAYSAEFGRVSSAADVLAPGVTCDSAIALQQPKAQVVLQHNPITDIYEDCWADGAKLELGERDATAGLSDPLF